VGIGDWGGVVAYGRGGAKVTLVDLVWGACLGMGSRLGLFYMWWFWLVKVCGAVCKGWGSLFSLSRLAAVIKPWQAAQGFPDVFAGVCSCPSVPSGQHWRSSSVQTWQSQLQLSDPCQLVATGYRAASTPHFARGSCGGQKFSEHPLGPSSSINTSFLHLLPPNPKFDPDLHLFHYCGRLSSRNQHNNNTPSRNRVKSQT